jgi:hypothetical protein
MIAEYFASDDKNSDDPFMQMMYWLPCWQSGATIFTSEEKNAAGSSSKIGSCISDAVF